MAWRLASQLIAFASENALTISMLDGDTELTGTDAHHVARAVEAVAKGRASVETIDDEIRELLMDLGILVADVAERDALDQNVGACLRIDSLFDDVGFSRAAAARDGRAVLVQLAGAIVFPLAHTCAWCARERLLARRPPEVWAHCNAIAHGTVRLIAHPQLTGRGALTKGIARAFEMLGSDPVVIDESGSLESHPLLRHPRCPHCRPPPTLTRADAMRDLARVLVDRPRHAGSPSGEGALFDGVFGPLTRSSVSTKGAGFRALPIVQGGIAYIGGGGHRSSTQTAAMGSGPDLGTREAVLLSELVERYGLRARQCDVEQRTAEELGDDAVSPAAFAGFRPEDRALFALPFIDGDRNVPLDWVWGLDLHARCPRLVPYDHVVLERGGDLTARLLELHVSTGAASHPHASSAIYSGLREVIERDAAMIAWYKRVALPRVTLPRVLKNVVADELRAHLIRRGLTFEVFDLRLDVPMPGVFIVATRTRTDGAFEAGATVAASAMGADIETALAHALQELAFHDETLSLFPDPSKDWRRTTYDPRSTSEGRGSWWPLYTHYLNPAHRDAFSFLLSSKKSVALEDIPPLAGQSDAERVTELVALLARVHTQAPIVVDLATPDMLAAARTTVKVLVPGFIDAASGRQTMRLASSRVEGAVRARALPCLAVDLWNPDPHPAM